MFSDKILHIVSIFLFLSCKEKKQEVSQFEETRSDTSIAYSTRGKETLQQSKNLINIKNDKDKTYPTTWNGKYSGSFLRLKDEAADPRAMGQINLEINGKRATLKIDSYVENVQKSLEVVTESKEELKLKDLSTGKFLTISQKSGKIMMKGELMESIAKTSDQYEIEKITK